MLSAGTKLGAYEIVAQIGAGGMGEVYRARDTKLGRDVALKVLPPAFAGDAERMARFQREAKVLASLNHPNIATIHGLEDSGTTHALVMELVEGPTLADRIKQGPIPIEEALRIARQICEALEYAHERGIVHRDLKPANVKVTSDDAVKILDFGLAKALEGDAASADISTSPTISRMATMQGVLLGTAAYMSPEQAKAKPVDRRADIWAFGCVLYEMLTGKQAFTGETVTDTLAAVIMKDPDLSQLPTRTPMRVRVLLQRCLQKDPKQRLRDIGDGRISLDEVLAGASEGTPGFAATVPIWRRSIPWIVGVLAVGIAGFAGWHLKPAPSSPPRPVTRTVITLPPGDQLAALDHLAIAISPDGTQLAYVAIRSGVSQIYVRPLSTLEAKPLAGTEGANTPFFSPDGQWLGFFADGKLKKISVNGGAVLTLADAPHPSGATWSSHGTIIFTPMVGPLQQVPDAGGPLQPLTRTAVEKGEVVNQYPEFLPGEQGVLFATGPDIHSQPIAVQSLRSGERRNLVQGGTMPHYASSGHLLYVQGGNLMAAPFDAQKLQLTGAPVPVLAGILEATGNGVAQYSISATGSLVYVSGGTQAAKGRLVWVSRNGREQVLPASPHIYFQVRLSPDGRRVAVTIQEPESQIWLYDLGRDTLTRFSFSGSLNGNPVWAPDGKRIAFVSNTEGPSNVFWEAADGSGGLERLTTSKRLAVPTSFSPDGQLLAYEEFSPPTSVSVLRLTDRKTTPFLQTSFDEGDAVFSPDGHWLAYVSGESGQNEVYAQPYPGPGGKHQISAEGGTEPVWNSRGKELFYRNGDRMMAVDVTTQPGFSAGKPKMVFEGPYVVSSAAFPDYDVSPDGQRFLMIKPTEQTAAPTQIVIVQNWFDKLKRLVPTGK